MKTFKLLIFKSLMMLFVIGFCFWQNLSLAQHVMLNQNNVNARLSNNGLFFNSDPNGGQLGYEVPAGAGTNLLFSSSLWFGGILPNSELGIAAMMFGQAGMDFWPGPIAANYNAPEYISNYGTSIWSFEEGEIDLYRTWWETCSGPNADVNACASLMPAQVPSVTLIDKINNWPAHGDVANGEAEFLAPFLDYNNDQEYNPADGDYPKLKGCSGVYLILNDAKGIHTESGGNPLGIEIHYTFYQYASTNDVDNTTFFDVQVFNRSTSSIEDFTSAFYFDGDLGAPSDDYIGCDTSRNLGYQYNGDNNDMTTGPSIGYGMNPPAFGIKALDVTMNSFLTFTNGGAFPNNDPSGPVQIWNAMNGKLQDGSSILDNTLTPTNYAFSGNPNDIGSYSEIQELNTPGDRRSVMGVKLGDFDPTIDEYETTTSKKMSFAVIYSRTGNNLENVSSLLQTADFIQDFYDNQNLNCASDIAGLDDLEQNSIVLYPNPTTNTMSINMDTEEVYQGKIISITGQEVHSFSTAGKSTSIDCSHLENGMYILQVTDGSKIISKQFVKAD